MIHIYVLLQQQNLTFYEHINMNSRSRFLTEWHENYESFRLKVNLPHCWMTKRNKWSSLPPSRSAILTDCELTIWMNHPRCSADSNLLWELLDFMKKTKERVLSSLFEICFSLCFSHICETCEMCYESDCNVFMFSLTHSVSTSTRSSTRSPSLQQRRKQLELVKFKTTGFPLENQLKHVDL